jgi:uncharacterized Zn finger protein
VTTYGRTDWGKRWLRTLEQLGLTYPDSRMARGRGLVGKEAVDLLHAEPGEISAWVDAPRKSFGVSITLPIFDAARWRRFDEVTASRLGNLADLMDDRLPTGIDRQLEPFGLSLFPSDGELSTSCPCKDRTPVCVHVIAVTHAFTVWFDDDPFLLPLMRGRERSDLIDALRASVPAIDLGAPLDETMPVAELATADFYASTTNLEALAR